MPVAVDFQQTGQTFASNSNWTYSHPVGAGLSNSILLVYFSCENFTPTGVTYAGNAMTLVNSSTVPSGTYVYRLLNPPSGANNVVISFGASAAFGGASSTSFSGVDQATPINTSTPASGTSTSHLVTITPTVANTYCLVVNTNNFNDAMTVNANTTEILQITADNRRFMAGFANVAAAGARIMGWTVNAAFNDQFNIVAVALTPSGGSSATPQTSRLMLMGVG